MFDNPPALRHSPLDSLHTAHGGRLVSFAGWRLPVQFPAGIIAEVAHCRAAAALFDVSHMAQIDLHGAQAQAALERLVPADLRELAQGRQRYTQLLTDSGGIIDDLIIGHLPDRWRLPGRLRLVVNASRAAADLAHLQAALSPAVSIVPRGELALLALQGPLASRVLARHAPAVAALPFMGVIDGTIRGVPATIARCGYTGEDGYEIALPAGEAAGFARALLAEPEVMPAGLGARDALRLEAGLCLYGQDIDEGTTPVEAGLGWSIGRRRRREGGFRGSDTVLAQLAAGPDRRLVGLRPEGRAPARAGAPIQAGGRVVGCVTSGGFSPTLNAPIALGYVRRGSGEPDTGLSVIVRDRQIAAARCPLPFVAKRYAGLPAQHGGDAA